MTRALITGATSGIGLAFARALAADGYDLTIVARSRDRLGAVAGDLSERFGVTVDPVVADLATRGGVETVRELIASADVPVDVLVNNAGFGLRAPFLESDLADIEELDDVINRAYYILSWQAGRTFAERGRGGIINVTSMAGMTTMGPYAALKQAATVMTENLANELSNSAVTVTAVLPGFVRTEFHDRAEMDMDWLPEAGWVDADVIARQGIADARAGKVISIPGALYKVAAALAWLAPRPVVRALSGGFRDRRNRRARH